jgi:hypothetical protein
MMALLQLVGAGICLVLPGVLLVGSIRHEWTPWVAALVGAALGCLIVPMVSFCVAWVLGTSLSAPLVMAVAVVTSAPSAGRVLYQRHKASA